jgi:hypothetical protein
VLRGCVGNLEHATSAEHRQNTRTQYCILILQMLKLSG